MARFRLKSYWFPLLIATMALPVSAESLDHWLGQKQMLDLRYYCQDGTPTKLCKSPVLSVPEALASVIVDHHIGGIILFADNLVSAQQTRQLTEQLQAIARDAGLPPLFIAIDQEGGRVSRLPDGVGNAFAGNMAIGATYQGHGVSFARQMNAAIAEQIKPLGFNVNFAPTVDVNVNPDNPVINVRSFGESAEMVADLGIAAVHALQQKGVISAMKHFPGHGDTHVDSHTGLPVVEHDRKQIDKVDLLPFSRAIEAGGLKSPAMIMTAHIQYPALDNSQFTTRDGDKTILPATLSRRILTGILREEMQYDGLIVTDALDMAGIAHYMDEASAMLATFHAGSDIALMPFTLRNPEDILRYATMMTTVKQRIHDGGQTTDLVPTREALRTSAERIAAVKATFLNEDTRSTANTEPQTLAVNINAEHGALEQALVEHAFTLIKGSEQLPIAPQLRIAALMPDTARCEALSFALKQRQQHRVSCLPLSSAISKDQIAQLLRSADKLIVGDISPQHSLAEMGGMDDLASWRDRMDKPTQYAAIHAALQHAKEASIPAIFIALRAPYVIDQFATQVDVALVTYDYRVEMQAAQPQGVIYYNIARWLAGDFRAHGVLPVSIDTPVSAETEL
ncbi:glycoside hydrolase family 3 protein [Alteromonas oceanisediminis]|uniref:glycoside hydrolase family 3 protein n=1 Tax=Alteromonas oceanisediminis TaxID=2836180 RepID=UPI001BD9ABD5|nr:glycoside hydrolase family 3 protein [Alteromonas oceanisediminis]MBT0585966.1 glycoside hydrolase family 3 protein [Alteromonas oceanisediminis]